MFATFLKRGVEDATLQDFVLSAIYKLGGEIKGATKLTKLLFLVDRTLEQRDDESPFDFKQYKYGPYDERIFETIEQLEEENLVQTQTVDVRKGEMYIYTLTDEGRKKAEEGIKKLNRPEESAIDDTLRAWSEASTNTLVSFIYDEYPHYAP